jgi:hypothetical protein
MTEAVSCGWETTLITSWHFQSPSSWPWLAWWAYLPLGFVVSLLIRGAAAAFRTIELPPNCKMFAHRFCRAFCGCSRINTRDDDIRAGLGSDRDNRGGPDWWLPFLIGTLELWSYPILMRVGAWTAIAAWLSFKTLAHWKAWQADRAPYNRYLLNNGLVLLAAYFLIPFVGLSHCPQ